jgi:malate dehydrogenase (oxaloacetate-decarboxylating)(NADP+)
VYALEETHAIRGFDLLHDPHLNKGTAFTDVERDRYGLRGLLPAHVSTQEEQLARVMENFRAKPNDLERYIFLIGLQDRNERLFYRFIMDNVEEMMPIIYTPEVGDACRHYAHIFRRPRGVFLSLKDTGRIAEALANWPEREVRIIVVTDGERILGLGDLGADGMGIPVGKLSLYTACAGVDPRIALPVTLDVGTNNSELLQDPLYIGLAQPRLRGEQYDAFVEEFVVAVQQNFPGALIQFEDFGNQNAFRLLHHYRHRCCTFNDDIQGTAAVALAGIASANRMTGADMTDHRVLFLGAGEAAVGIAGLIVSAMQMRGMTETEARRRIWMFDSKGLVVSGRPTLADHKRPFAHDLPPCDSLEDAIKRHKPTALIGVSGQPQRFNENIIRIMAALNKRPIIFALSNPTSKAECTAEQAYTWSEGRAIFASGSPFAPVEVGGQRFVPGQGNNAYIFPGVGLGVIASCARHVTDAMFYAAAETLADAVHEEDLGKGCVYPPLSRICEVSADIATAVASIAFDDGLATVSEPEDLGELVRAHRYDPHY